MSLPTVGLDIGKATFHAVLLINGKNLRRALPNTAAGHTQVLSWLAQKGAAKAQACMEATGSYGQALAMRLYQAGHIVSVVNPARIKAFARSAGERNKTDRRDAAIIARFCQVMQPDPWTPPEADELLLQKLSRRRDDLKAMRRQEENRKNTPETAQTVVQSIEAIIEVLNAQTTEIERQIAELIEKNARLRREHDLLTGIKGIAHDTAVTVMAEVGNVARFHDARQLAAYAGLTPKNNQSGTSVNKKTHLSKCGNARLRSATFYPAMVAMRYNPIVRAFAERLRKAGKPNMEIVGAAMRKLIHIIYGVLNSGMPFDPNFQPIHP